MISIFSRKGEQIMKHIGIITGIAASIALFGCNKIGPSVPATDTEEVSITCFTEQARVKTNLSGNDSQGYYVTWVSGDKIRTQSGTTGSSLTVTAASVGSTSATFTGTMQIDENATSLAALYPSYYPLGSTTALSVTAQNTYVGNQKYKADGPEFFPMYAYANEQKPEVLHFSNILGIIRIDLTNSGSDVITIKNISYTASSALIGSWNYEEVSSGVYKAVNKSRKDLTLDCGAGVDIAAGASASFWVSAFDGTYSDFSFTLKDTAEKELEVSLKTGKSFVVERSRISKIAISVSSDKFTVPLATNAIRYTTTDGSILGKYSAGDDFPIKTTSGASTAPITVTSHTFAGGEGLITFDSNVTGIGFEAFKDCSTLRTIDVPSTVKTVGVSAFQNCTSLEGIKLPKGTTTVQRSAFEGCTSLASAYLGNIPSLNQRTFFGCTSLRSFEIPSTVNTINSYVFQGSGLESMVIPDAVTNIQANTFYDCKSLARLTIGNGVTAIPATFCKGCTSLTEITIPASVETIGLQAFNGCKSLATIRFKRSASATAPAANDNATFNGCKNPGVIIVPDGCLADYVAAWRIGPNGTTTGCVPSYITIRDESGHTESEL